MENNTQTIIVLLAIGVIVLVGGWYLFSNDILPMESGNRETVAVVNGEKITKDDFESQLEETKNMATQQGMELEDEEIEGEVLDQMIATVLITQKAKEEGLEVTDKEIETEIDSMEQMLPEGTTLEDQLDEADLTRDDLFSLTKEQILVEKYFDKHLSEDDLEVTEEQMQTYYEQMSGQMDLPPMEEMEKEMKDQLRMQASQELQNELINELVESLREDAEIETEL